MEPVRLASAVSARFPAVHFLLLKILQQTSRPSKRTFEKRGKLKSFIRRPTSRLPASMRVRQKSTTTILKGNENRENSFLVKRRSRCRCISSVVNIVHG